MAETETAEGAAVADTGWPISDGDNPSLTVDASSQSAETKPDPRDEKIAQLETVLADMDARLQQTVGQLSQKNDGREFASALIESQRQQRLAWEQEQQARAQLAPPQWTEDEKARVIADPDLLYQKVMEATAYGHKLALAQVNNRIRQGEIMYGLGQPLVDLAADAALEKAKGFVKTHGMDPTELDRDDLLQATYQVMQEAAAKSEDPQLHYTRLTLNPQAIAAAAAMARTRVQGGPRIVNKKAPAPTVGAGDVGGDTRRAPLRSSHVIDMEKKLGHRFSEEALRKAAEKARQLDGVI